MNHPAAYWWHLFGKPGIAGVDPKFPNGIRDAVVIPELVSDHGCQPVSTVFFKAWSNAGIQQISTRYSSQKGNADTDRSIRKLKEDLTVLWNKSTADEGLPVHPMMADVCKHCRFE